MGDTRRGAADRMGLVGRYELLEALGLQQKLNCWGSGFASLAAELGIKNRTLSWGSELPPLMFAPGALGSPPLVYAWGSGFASLSGHFTRLLSFNKLNPCSIDKLNSTLDSSHDFSKRACGMLYIEFHSLLRNGAGLGEVLFSKERTC